MTRVIKRVFYSNTSAMVIEVSKNGIFMEIAPFKEKNQNGDNTFDWKENKLLVCFEPWEFSQFREGLRKFLEEGSEGYIKFAQKINNNEKYKNIQFVHELNGVQKRFGWMLNTNYKTNKTSLNTIINDGKSELKYFLQIQDLYLLLDWLGFCIQSNFVIQSKIEIKKAKV